VHSTLPLNLTWSALATGNGTTTPSYSGGSCSAVYCHGSYSGQFTYQPTGTDPTVTQPTTVTYQGLAASPSWSGTAPCGSCHGIPGLPTCSASVAPPCNSPSYAPAGFWHSGQHGYTAPLSDCHNCHPDAAGNGATATITNPAQHADGNVDLSPRFTTSGCRCHFF
jgi:hypothetical protein